MEMIVQGNGVGSTRTTYGELNELRAEVFRMENFFTVNRGLDGRKIIFEDFLPATVMTVQLTDIDGCDKELPHSCPAKVIFDADITAKQLINEPFNGCDWKKSTVQGLTTKYLAKTADAFANGEAKAGFDWLGAVLPASTVTTAPTERDLIEDLIVETLNQTDEDMGTGFVGRQHITVLMGRNHASAMRKKGLNCCNPFTGGADMSNEYGIRGMFEIPYLPANAIYVYVHFLKFFETTCVTPLGVFPLSDLTRSPDSGRAFAEEDYGFQEYKVGKNNAVAIAHAGVKFTGTPVVEGGTGTTQRAKA